tara:strand:- start:70 stop:366 length:297 start_codon:yes stop_codon:yes gene_type:complete
MNDKEDGNIIYTCKEHGEDLYFRVKNNPEISKEYVYCYFPVAPDGVCEKMWVKITKGDRQKGMGNLENKPQHSTFKHGELVKFVTDEKDITHAEKLTN